MAKLLILAFLAIAFCLLCIIGATVAQAGESLIEIRDVDLDALVVEGFELSEEGEIEIHVVGAGPKYSKLLSAYGWIIDAESRDVVWTMQDDCYDMAHMSGALYECEANEHLRPGRYEVYYYVGRHYQFITGDMEVSINDLGELIDFIGDVFTIEDGEGEPITEEDVEELFFDIRTEADAERYNPVFDEPPGSVVYINRPERDEMHERGFTLKDKTDLLVYAIGEYSESYDLFVDGACIVDADTRKPVWKMDKWNTDRAGGTGKNRYVRDVITLPAGNYIVRYATDDSHDFGEWNSPPPADPMNYGISVTVADPDDADHVKPYDPELVETEIVSLTRMKDSDFKKAAFELKRDARIHIVALGERNYGNDGLVDYGWINNAEDLEKVWEMTSDNTGFGGGAAKNARFDGIVDLPAGNYVVYFRTDDSHSYRDWNAAPPFEKEQWGISLYGVGANFSDSDFEELDDFQPMGDVIVDLTAIGDDVKESRAFELDKTTGIRIMALGEGKGGKMFDYGWIRNDDNGEIVWEMTYRKTRHAGGAEKNRIAVANIVLEKGNYTALYVTDDSHSYEHFNASPPDDPERWGIIITKR